jgi:hypothetical protein
MKEFFLGSGSRLRDISFVEVGTDSIAPRCGIIL